jgi:hypothetical protein
VVALPRFPLRNGDRELIRNLEIRNDFESPNSRQWRSICTPPGGHKPKVQLRNAALLCKTYLVRKSPQHEETEQTRGNPAHSGLRLVQTRHPSRRRESQPRHLSRVRRSFIRPSPSRARSPSAPRASLDGTGAAISNWERGERGVSDLTPSASRISHPAKDSRAFAAKSSSVSFPLSSKILLPNSHLCLPNDFSSSRASS